MQPSVCHRHHSLANTPISNRPKAVLGCRATSGKALTAPEQLARALKPLLGCGAKMLRLPLVGKGRAISPGSWLWTSAYPEEAFSRCDTSCFAHLFGPRPFSTLKLGSCLASKLQSSLHKGWPRGISWYSATSHCFGQHPLLPDAEVLCDLQLHQSLSSGPSPVWAQLASASTTPPPDMLVSLFLLQQCFCLTSKQVASSRGVGRHSAAFLEHAFHCFCLQTW